MTFVRMNKSSRHRVNSVAGQVGGERRGIAARGRALGVLVERRVVGAREVDDGRRGGFTDGESVVEATGVDHVARIELLARGVRAAWWMGSDCRWVWKCRMWMEMAEMAAAWSGRGCAVEDVVGIWNVLALPAILVEVVGSVMVFGVDTRMTGEGAFGAGMDDAGMSLFIRHGRWFQLPTSFASSDVLISGELYIL